MKASINIERLGTLELAQSFMRELTRASLNHTCIFDGVEYVVVWATVGEKDQLVLALI
ncbi:hypothetical protein [uncultured Shewanella sp.]|uniref:hypothetical protein n=1 Tax=uncultured Shewanella sp. TaxID=173975 RepID=UPI00260EC24C|nr:hypothetical protein [uncultured Shewanella sp.]